MLHLFVSNPVSQPDQRRRRRNPVLVSMAVHALLLLIVIAPARPARYATKPSGTMETVRYMTLAVPVSEPAHGRSARRAMRSPRSPHVQRAPRMPMPPRTGKLDLTFALTLVSQPVLPDVAAPNMVDTLSGDALKESPFASPHLGSVDLRGRGPDSLTYIATDVDRSAALAGTNPKPGYPVDLLRRSIEATFSVYFVVDTVGRVDTATIQIPIAVEPGFAKAVRAVLVRWHFVPAEIRGRRVRQMMEQTFQFKIINGQYARSSRSGWDVAE